MSYRDRIIFVSLSGKPVYDPKTGQYSTPHAEEKKVPCDVSDLGFDMSIKLFGSYQDGRKIVHLLRPFKTKFDHVLYHNEKYKVFANRLNKSVFYIEKDTGTV